MDVTDKTVNIAAKQWSVEVTSQTHAVYFSQLPPRRAPRFPSREEVNPIMHWAESCQATVLSRLTLRWVNRLVTDRTKERSEVTWKLFVFKR